MIGGYSGVVAQYASISAKISKTNPKVPADISICRIDSIDENKLTVNITVLDDNKIYTNISLSFPTKGNGYGSYFMPIVGEIALLVTTSYGRKYVLCSSCVTDNTNGERLMAGENMILSYSGAYLKQDNLGNHVISSSSGNFTFYNDNLSNTEISTGKEEVTTASNIVRGFGLYENKICDSVLKDSTIKLVNYEQYYNNIQTIKTYSGSDILDNNVLNYNIANEILTNSNSVIMDITNFINKAGERFTETYSNVDSKDQVDSETQTYATDVSTNFKLSKNASLVIQKGNAVSKKIDSLDDIYSLTPDDFKKSSDGNDIIFQLTVLDSDTQQENASITIDSKGNGYMKFNKLNITTSQGCYIDGVKQ